MKKYLFSIIAVVCITAIAAVNMYISQKRDVKLSSLGLANVEALAQDEWGQGMPEYCFMNKSVWYCIMQRGDTACYCEM